MGSSSAESSQSLLGPVRFRVRGFCDEGRFIETHCDVFLCPLATEGMSRISLDGNVSYDRSIDTTCS
jgi:hypothetical protein